MFAQAGILEQKRDTLNNMELTLEKAIQREEAIKDNWEDLSINYDKALTKSNELDLNKFHGLEL